MQWSCLVQDLTSPTSGCEVASAVKGHHDHGEGSKSQVVP